MAPELLKPETIHIPEADLYPDFADEETEPEFTELDDIENKSVDELSEDGTEPDDIFGQFIKEASKKPLLTPEEESDLARKMDAGRTFIKGRRTVENMRLTDEAREAFNELIERNLLLVVSQAKIYQYRGMEMTDLVGLGNIGLVKGIAKFEPERGYKLSTYTTWWIRQSISRGIADCSRSIRRPVYYHDKLNRFMHTVGNLIQEYGRSPTREEIAGRMGIDTASVDILLKDLTEPISIDTPVKEGDHFDDDEIGDFIADGNSQVADEGDESIIRDKVRSAWARIPDLRDRLIIGYRYGFIGGKSLTLEATAEKFGLTRERIRQIEAKKKKNLKILLWKYKDVYK